MNVEVFLVNVDPRGNGLTTQGRTETEIADKLNALFRFSIQRASILHLNTHNTITARWHSTFDIHAPTPQAPIGVFPKDIVIYFVPNTSLSVVSQIGQLQPSSNETGFTNFVRGGITGSEVYTRPAVRTSQGWSASWLADQMAAVAYHECLHYKPQFDDHQLHNHTDAQNHPDVRIGQASAPAYVMPSDGDTRILINNLGNQWPPFIDGVETYKRLWRAQQSPRSWVPNF